MRPRWLARRVKFFDRKWCNIPYIAYDSLYFSITPEIYSNNLYFIVIFIYIEKFHEIFGLRKSGCLHSVRKPCGIGILRRFRKRACIHPGAALSPLKPFSLPKMYFHPFCIKAGVSSGDEFRCQYTEFFLWFSMV